MYILNKIRDNFDFTAGAYTDLSFKEETCHRRNINGDFTQHFTKS